MTVAAVSALPATSPFSTCRRDGRLPRNLARLSNFESFMVSPPIDCTGPNTVQSESGVAPSGNDTTLAPMGPATVASAIAVIRCNTVRHDIAKLVINETSNRIIGI